MKKICTLLLFAGVNAAFGQSILIEPKTVGGSTTNIIKTPTDAYGMEHTDGTIRLQTYVNNANAGFLGAWLQTYTNHALILSTANGYPQLSLNNN